MKTLFVSIGILCVISASAQVKKTNNNKPGKITVAKYSKTNMLKKSKTTTNILSSTNNYSAKASTGIQSKKDFSISDPTILALNARANGALVV